MKAIALIKQVPDRNSAFRIEGDWIDERSLGYGMNDYDRYAVEAALQLKEAGHVEEVVAASAGPDDASQILRACLAMGADRAIHVAADRTALRDPLAVARALAGIVREESAGIVTCGLLAEDSGHAQVGGLVAGLLGHAFASAATAIRFEDGRLLVDRELENNRIAVVELRLPAVVAVQTGINAPRYASLRGIMAARRKPFRRVEWAEASGSDSDQPGLRHVTLRKPERSASAEMLRGSPEEIAEALVSRIRSGAGVL